MIQVLHVSAECYPAAKTGGLGDVVGSLPKYMTQADILSAAIIPKYATKWINQASWITVYQSNIWVDWQQHYFEIHQHEGNTLGYPLFTVHLPGLFDRPGIYNDPSGAPYGDEIRRSVAFQQAVLDWLLSFPWHDRPRVIHCHDHHTALIPWMMKYVPAYQQLAPVPTVFTIHNGQYQGAFGWSNAKFLPPYESGTGSLLDWNGIINPMAGAIKTAWAVTTVSNSYLYELHQSSLGLEPLFQQEWRKEWGIVNGIDAVVWDPETDPMIQTRLENGAIDDYKQKNKAVLCEWFGLRQDWPLVSFIGRMVGEKGSDLLPDVFKRFLDSGARVSFLVLGTGETWTQNEFRRMAHAYPGRFNAVIDYNEALSHQIYAGSDFLIMPSRVEPCGLNQLYSMRYGTIPIVRSIGGLKDTVPDIGEPDGSGRGIRFDQFSVEDAVYAVYRAASLWHENQEGVSAIRKKIMGINFSWENTIDQYINVYNSLLAGIKPEKVSLLPETSPVETTPVKKAGAVKKSAPKAREDKDEVIEQVTKKSSSRSSTSKSGVSKKTASKASDDKPDATKPASKKTKKTKG